MKVFISWSGHRSRAVADELKTWLKSVVQSTQPWVSTDMERGIKWIAEVNRNLDQHSFGILCVTPDNVNSRWINYESGALAKHLGDGGRVIPYLLDFHSPGDLEEPLAQFNAALADKDGTWEVVKTLNQHAEFAQEEPSLRKTFELWWPSLSDGLEKIQAMKHQVSIPQRSQEDKIDELLQLVRELSRETTENQETIHSALRSLPRGNLNQDEYPKKHEILSRLVEQSLDGKRVDFEATWSSRDSKLTALTIFSDVEDGQRDSMMNQIHRYLGSQPVIRDAGNSTDVPPF